MKNNVLYALEERQGYLRLWDISDFANPHSLAQVNSPAGATFHELGIRGNFVYLATQLGSFQIWDVSTPSNPIKKGELSWPDVKIMDLYVSESGDLIYIAYANPSGQSGYQVKIINAANPQAPQVVKTLETTGLPSALAGEGNFLYVASNLLQQGRWILTAYNVTNPANPFSADTLQGSGQSYELEVKDGVIIGTFPGGTVRYFVYDQHGNQLISGPAVHSGDDNRLATATDQQGNLVSYVMQGYVYISGSQCAHG
ncbi:MAG: hypothetical protein ONB13_07735 [candidate division KSB1 bacterium]|nr:hypothetical protein [candidate division KSB1 bacterium]